MKDLNVSEFKTRIAAYLRQVEEGEVLIITDHKRPVAEVHRIGPRKGLVQRAEKPFSLPENPEIVKKDGLASQLLNEKRGTQ